MKRNNSKQNPKRKTAGSVKRPVKKYSNSRAKWDETSDTNLEILLSRKLSVNDISRLFGRTQEAVRSRIRKLKLKDMLKKTRILLLTGIMILFDGFSEMILYIM